MANSFVGTRVCYRRDIRENRRDEAGPQFINNPTGQGKRKQGYWKLSAGFGNKIEIEIGEVQRGIPYYLDAGSGTIVPRQNFYLDFVWTLIVHPYRSFNFLQQFGRVIMSSFISHTKCAYLQFQTLQSLQSANSSQ